MNNRYDVVSLEMRLGVKMPWIPDDLEAELPHQAPRRDKPVVPKQKKTGQEDTLPSLLPKISMRSTVSLHDEPDDRVVRFTEQPGNVETTEIPRGGTDANISGS